MINKRCDFKKVNALKTQGPYSAVDSAMDF